MRDILDIRRYLVLTENAFPDQLQTAFRGMERAYNPWNIPQEKRLEWAEGLRVTTVAEKPQAEILWWVGCAPATEARAQKTGRALSRVLPAARGGFALFGPAGGCHR